MKLSQLQIIGENLNIKKFLQEKDHDQDVEGCRRTITLLNHDQIRITDHDHGHIRKRMIGDHQTKSISEEAMKKLQKLKTPNL